MPAYLRACHLPTGTCMRTAAHSLIFLGVHMLSEAVSSESRTTCRLYISQLAANAFGHALKTFWSSSCANSV